MATQITVYQA